MADPVPLHPPPLEGSHKKVIYFVRHAEAEHNVLERQAVQAVIAAGGETDRQEEARRAVLHDNPSLKDARLSQNSSVAVMRARRKGETSTTSGL